MGCNYKIIISVPKVIVLAILIVKSIHCLTGLEEQDEDGNVAENQFGRKVRRIMRTTTATEANPKSMVSELCILIL